MESSGSIAKVISVGLIAGVLAVWAAVGVWQKRKGQAEAQARERAYLEERRETERRKAKVRADLASDDYFVRREMVLPLVRRTGTRQAGWDDARELLNPQHPQSVVPLLIEALISMAKLDKDPSVRGEAASALGEMFQSSTPATCSNPRVVDALITAVRTDSSVSVRESAARALEAIRDPRGTRVSGPFVASMAREAARLREADERAMPYLCICYWVPKDRFGREIRDKKTERFRKKVSSREECVKLCPESRF